MGLFQFIVATCGLAIAVCASDSNETTSVQTEAESSEQWSPKRITHGTGNWGGRIKIRNNLPAECKYSKNSATWFSPNGRGDLVQGQSVDLGPFGGWYTLGVQENVFANCAYPGTCAWNNHSADQYCFNFSVDANCGVHYNDCPYPAGQPGKNNGLSPAPDGRKRYSINGVVDNTGTCVLTVNRAGNGPFFCDATW